MFATFIVTAAILATGRMRRTLRVLLVFCRTDYHLATPALAALARAEHIYKDVKFSDHAPISVDYDFSL